MKGFMAIRVMADGRYFDVWQQIEDGHVVGHVRDDGTPVELPEPCESHCLTGQLHYAPNVLHDPNAKLSVPIAGDVESLALGRPALTQE